MPHAFPGAALAEAKPAEAWRSTDKERSGGHYARAWVNGSYLKAELPFGLVRKMCAAFSTSSEGVGSLFRLCEMEQ